MSHFNYRIIRRDYSQSNPDLCEEDSIVFGIHEVYYGKKEKISMWTGTPINLTGISVEDLRLLFEHIEHAFEKPVLVEKKKGKKLILIEWEEEK